jgi:hypothetical protein
VAGRKRGPPRRSTPHRAPRAKAAPVRSKGRETTPRPALDLRGACLEALAARGGARKRGQASPLEPGQLGTPITLASASSSKLFRLAFAAAAGARAGEEGDDPAAGDVVWTDGDSELLVHAARARLVTIEGFALAGLPVFTEQTDEVEVVVPFATGTPRAPLGLVVATEPEPRGPLALVARWGDPLVAAAWQALLDLIGELAASSGVDARKEPLLPAVLAASPRGLHLTAQARHAFDRERPWP